MTLRNFLIFLIYNSKCGSKRSRSSKTLPYAFKIPSFVFIAWHTTVNDTNEVPNLHFVLVKLFQFVSKVGTALILYFIRKQTEN